MTEDKPKYLCGLPSSDREEIYEDMRVPILVNFTYQNIQLLDFSFGDINREKWLEEHMMFKLK